jgi:acyl carrier protein
VVANVSVKSLSFQEILDDVTRITTQISGKSISSPREDLAALGIDSLMMLDLLSALEEHFGITLSETITREFRTTDRVARIIQDIATS